MLRAIDSAWMSLASLSLLEKVELILDVSILFSLLFIVVRLVSLRKLARKLAVLSRAMVLVAILGALRLFGIPFLSLSGTIFSWVAEDKNTFLQGVAASIVAAIIWAIVIILLSVAYERTNRIGFLSFVAQFINWLLYRNALNLNGIWRNEHWSYDKDDPGFLRIEPDDSPKRDPGSQDYNPEYENAQRQQVYEYQELECPDFMILRRFNQDVYAKTILIKQENTGLVEKVDPDESYLMIGKIDGINLLGEWTCRTEDPGAFGLKYCYGIDPRTKSRTAMLDGYWIESTNGKPNPGRWKAYRLIPDHKQGSFCDRFIEVITEGHLNALNPFVKPYKIEGKTWWL